MKVCEYVLIKINDNHYNNATEYELMTREDTSILINRIMVIHKEIGGKSMISQAEADIGGYYC